MSVNWIQLIGLLLVSSQVVDNALDPGNNLDHSSNLLTELNEQNSFNCENGETLKLNSDRLDEFNQLQITSPSDARLNCRLLFSANRHERIEIVLNDVQLATTHINNSSLCGTLKFEEWNRSLLSNFCLPVQNRVENFYKVVDEDVNRLDHQIVNQTNGIYLSNSNNLTLNINSLVSFNRLASLPILTVNYRFINSKPDVEAVDFREKFNCDRLFNQCRTPACKLIQSTSDSSNDPETNFANFTCKYLISQQNQSTNRIVVSQLYANSSSSASLTPLSSYDCPNSIKFYDGRLELEEKLITKFCLPIYQMPLVRSDSNQLLIVYNSRINDEESNQLQLIAQIENKKTRLVNERKRKSLPFDTLDQSCNVYYNASTTSQRSGQIVFRNQLQNQLKDTPCFMHLISSNPFDRIWFYFLNYRASSLINTNQMSNQYQQSDSCKITELKLFDTLDESNNLINKGKLFCGNEQPKICNPNRQQCWLPSESYLSSGPKLSLMAINKINPSLYLLPLQFTLNYEFVNTQEYGEAVPNTICDRLFDSSRFKHGTVRSSRNLFLFGRGGRSNLNCAYIFRGQPGQHLRIQLYRIKVKSTDCTQQRESNSGTNKCVHVNGNSLQNSRPNGPSSRFSVWDILNDANGENTSEQSTNQLRIPVDCFCNRTVNFLTPISFHLIGGQATLNFTIENMRSSEDFNDFGFEAFYEFLSTSNDHLTLQTFVPLETHPRNVQLKTNPPKNYSLTTYSLAVPSNYSFDYYQEFKQRLHLKAKPNENVLINVPNGFLWKNSVSRTCNQLNNRLIVYWILPSNPNQFSSLAQKSSTDSNNNAVATICIEPYRGDLEADNKLDALNPDQIQLSFELNSKNNQHPSNSRTLKFYANNTVKQIDLVIELVATSKGQFRFDWLESLNKQEFHSSMRTSEPKSIDKSNDNNNKLSTDNNLNFNTNSNSNGNSSTTTHQCLAYCPEDGLCLKQENLCDQISHCLTSGWDESVFICEAKDQNRLEHFLSVQTDNKIDKITVNDSILKSNWFVILSLFVATLVTFAIVGYLIVYFRRRNKHNHSMASSSFPTHLQIGSLNNNTLQTGSASSTFSGNSSLTNSSCTNSMLCDKKFKKMKQKMLNKEQLKQQKHLQSKLQQPSNALTLIRSGLEAPDNNFNQLLIPSFGNNSTIIHQQIHQQQQQLNQLNQPADYVSTSEFQFELNQDRLNNYDKQNDFSLLYKKQDQDEYSLKQQHIYYQPAYTTLQRNTREGNKNLEYRLDNQRIDFRIDRRMDQNSLIDKPPLPPLPSVLQQTVQQQNQQLLSYPSTTSNNESHHQETFNQSFGLRSQLNSHLTNLNNHHTIARQSLLQDSSTQAERLLMNTPIYEVADRQFNNSSTMHRSALLRAGRRFS